VIENWNHGPGGAKYQLAGKNKKRQFIQ